MIEKYAKVNWLSSEIFQFKKYTIRRDRSKNKNYWTRLGIPNIQHQTCFRRIVIFSFKTVRNQFNNAFHGVFFFCWDFSNDLLKNVERIT